MTKNKKIDKQKWGELLAKKTPETHAKVMQKLGISEEEDKKWHQKYGGKPADFNKFKTNENH
ncbi:MAG: hypothetical protein AAB785_01570 [Patescibacteria group bacterium]